MVEVYLIIDIESCIGDGEKVAGASLSVVSCCIDFQR